LSISIFVVKGDSGKFPSRDECMIHITGSFFLVLLYRRRNRRNPMNERSIVAAILTIASMRSQLQQGAQITQAVDLAISVYEMTLARLAQKNLPPPQPTP
jgi:hypothetical protein